MTPSARLLALVAAAVVAVPELGTRALFHQDALVYQDSHDPALRFELRPNVSGDKSGAYVQINSQGLRERDIPERKPANEFRVVAVGDQFTFGLGLPVEQDYLRVLEGLVPKLRGKTIRTVNLSMYNYNFSQKLALLQSRGLRYEPDLIVFEVGPKDLDALPKALVELPSLKNWIRSHSAFLRLVSERIYWSRNPTTWEAEAPPPPEPEEEKPSKEPRGKAGAAKQSAEEKELPTLPELRALQKLLTERLRVPVLVLYRPDISAKDAKSTYKLEREFEKACRRLGLPFYSLTREFQGHARQELLLRPGQPWYSARAHRMAAAAVGRELKRLAPPRKPVSQRPGV